MFHTVFYLRTFRVVEALHAAYEVPRNAPDTLKLHTFTDKPSLLQFHVTSCSAASLVC